MIYRRYSGRYSGFGASAAEQAELDRQAAEKAAAEAYKLDVLISLNVKSAADALAKKRAEWAAKIAAQMNEVSALQKMYANPSPKNLIPHEDLPKYINEAKLVLVRTQEQAEADLARLAQLLADAQAAEQAGVLLPSGTAAKAALIPTDTAALIVPPPTIVAKAPPTVEVPELKTAAMIEFKPKPTAEEVAKQQAEEAENDRVRAELQAAKDATRQKQQIRDETVVVEPQKNVVTKEGSSTTDVETVTTRETEVDIPPLGPKLTPLFLPPARRIFGLPPGVVYVGGGALGLGLLFTLFGRKR